MRRINDMLDRRWLTNRGLYVQEFENEVAKLLGVEHCIAICNGTVALEIAARALGLCGEVILPSFTFVATAHALMWQGITPVFCDIDTKTFVLDPRRVEELITPKTTGIVGVHLWGIPCAIRELSAIARKHRLKLMFDAAHAFACSFEGIAIGNFGDAEVFSFHATKILNTFEGGAIVTNNSELAAKIRSMKNFGFSGYDEVSWLGTNGKMSEISAAMGLTGLESLDEFIRVNLRNYEVYRCGLEGVSGLQVLTYDISRRSNFQYVAIEIDEIAAGISRNQVMEILWAENVLARRYFYPGCHRMEPYGTLMPDVGSRLSGTEWLAQRILVLPTGTAIQRDDIEKICDLIRFSVVHGGEIATKMKANVFQAVVLNQGDSCPAA
jgi:dTDP-4-amino-4,6-dideoxygalactose transaminase